MTLCGVGHEEQDGDEVESVVLSRKGRQGHRVSSMGRRRLFSWLTRTTANGLIGEMWTPR